MFGDSHFDRAALDRYITGNYGEDQFINHGGFAPGFEDVCEGCPFLAADGDKADVDGGYLISYFCTEPKQCDHVKDAEENARKENEYWDKMDAMYAAAIDE